MKDELRHLRDDYLLHRNTILRYDTNNTPRISEEELREMLNALQQFERPDMYAIVGNKVYILEHFVFDASLEEEGTGMEGIKKERLLSQRADKAVPDGEWHIDKAVYPISLANFQRNFEAHFKDHYEKIEEYKGSVLGQKLESGNYELIVGFWVENQYPPLFQIGSRFSGELYYFSTKQFSNLLLEHSKIDFMLFGCNCNGPQLFYIDRFTLCPKSQQIDLMSEGISLSHLNQNEVTMYGAFTL